MATSRRRNLIRSRRRIADEGEDEDSGPVTGLDSQSEGSNFSDADDNLDADDSELSDEASTHDSVPVKSGIEVNGKTKNNRRRKGKLERQPSEASTGVDRSKGTAFKNTSDTDAMINGLSSHRRGNDEGEAIQFADSMEPESVENQIVPESQHAISASPLNTRQSGERREIEPQASERMKASNKPPLIPNRGGFFMHDQRNGAALANGMGPPGRGRGRGRGGAMILPEPVLGSGQNGRWDHDLHDTLLDSGPAQPGSNAPSGFQRKDDMQTSNAAPSLSKSISIGTVPLRVLLPNMQKPITFEKMPVKQHTRLPDLRPPLRRDKPVRVFVPSHAPRYIFPSVERSFIFIPRAQRPNQQRGRMRGTRQSSQFGSRRTSVYGGSNYSPSVAMSRRSSQARDGIISPTGSTMSRPPLGVPGGTTRPVVKLPAGARVYDQAATMNAYMPSGGEGLQIPQAPQQWLSYPLPSRPTYRENRSNQIPMHQPKPQKAVSVATIESPVPQVPQTSNEQDQQPFHHQVPAHLNMSNPAQIQPFNPSFATSQPFGDTSKPPASFSNMSEQAIDAQPFQPSAMQQPQPHFTPNYPMQSMVFYPPSEGQDVSYQSGNNGMYIPPNQQGGYMMPVFMPQPNMAEQTSSPGQASMYAHESNGMVYYYDPSMGETMPSGADGYFYNGTSPQPMMYYYPQ